jgi:GNAT superfamily N-acetyltransferase
MFRQATVSLRPETAEDRSFLRELHLSVREEEAGFRDLDPAARTALLDQQFEWQHAQYLAQNPHGWFTIVLVDDQPAGRFYLTRRAAELRVVDISLLTEYRGHGIGSQLMLNVRAESLRIGLPIRLSVVAGDPVRGFYQRLGFRLVSRDEIRLELEWAV